MKCVRNENFIIYLMNTDYVITQMKNNDHSYVIVERFRNTFAVTIAFECYCYFPNIDS